MASTSLHNFQKALTSYEKGPVDLEGTLDELVRILATAVQTLKAELIAETGLSAQHRTITRDFSQKLKEVTAALTAATSCQNALYKTAKQRASTMTAEERQTALKRIVNQLDYYTRRALIGELVEQHNAIAVIEREQGGGLGFDGQHTSDRPGPTTMFVELR